MKLSYIARCRAGRTGAERSERRDANQSRAKQARALYFWTRHLVKMVWGTEVPEHSQSLNSTLIQFNLRKSLPFLACIAFFLRILSAGAPIRFAGPLMVGAPHKAYLWEFVYLTTLPD